MSLISIIKTEEDIRLAKAEKNVLEDLKMMEELWMMTKKEVKQQIKKLNIAETLKDHIKYMTNAETKLYLQTF